MVKRVGHQKLENCFSKCNFHFVWLQQRFGNVNVVLEIFKQRLMDFFFCRRGWERYKQKAVILSFLSAFLHGRGKRM